MVIVGQTASGKSALALELAKRFNGEIICADSRTLYKGMDIGTAKPSKEDRDAIRHHLIDVTSVDMPLTVSDFKVMADKAIGETNARGKLPFLVGGTGLYVDAVVHNFSFRVESDPDMRRELEKLSVKELQNMLAEQGIPLPSNVWNSRHLIRQIETNGQRPTASTRPDTLIVGIQVEREDLQERIDSRVHAMFALGLEDEVRELVSKYGWDATPLQTIGYQEFRDYFDGKISQAELKQLIVQHTMQYAKRQKTWFKRNKSITWISKTEEVVDLITTLLNKTI